MSIESESPNSASPAENTLQGVVMRDYIPDDREKLLDVFDTLSPTPEGRAALESLLWCELTRDMFEKYVDETSISHRTLVFSSAGQLLGWGEYCAGDEKSDIAAMSRFVLPEFQGRGIGTALAEYLIKRCRERHPQVGNMLANVYNGNGAALQSLIKSREQWVELPSQSLKPA